MLCYFASASDDAADYFFAIDDDEPLPQYSISHKIFSLLHLKILTPSHLMDLKSIRPSPYWKFCHSKSIQPSPVIHFDIQRKTTKRLKENAPYRIKNRIWPVSCILMEKNKKWTRTFLTKWLKHSIQKQSKTPPIQASTRWRTDGTYNKKPLDPDYFNKYYQKKLSTPFQCPDCGRTISSKSNLSKHRQTKICMTDG